MKIAIPTIGSRGDVQPFIALAQGLGRVGHAITLASHPVMVMDAYG
jgi:UDP:flavonoid glycosyltransferase YjiC (YdhE family)